MKIYLIGLPGVGKTKIGRLIAEKLKINFYDTDDIIERTTNQTPKDLINLKGEKYFRFLETEVLKNLIDVSGVISCGGGIIENSENKNYLDGMVVYLKCKPEDISFTKDEIEKRPLLKKSGIQELYEKRNVKYEQFSNLIINVSNMNSDEIANEVIKNYENLNH